MLGLRLGQRVLKYWIDSLVRVRTVYESNFTLSDDDCSELHLGREKTKEVGQIPRPAVVAWVNSSSAYR